MTDRRVKSDSGADGEASDGIPAGDLSQMNVFIIFRVQNIVQGLLGFNRQMKIPDKVVAGAGRNVSEGDLFQCTNKS